MGRFEIVSERTDSHDHFLSADYEWRVLDRLTGDCVARFEETQSGGASDVRFSPDGREVVVTKPEGGVERFTVPVFLPGCSLWLRADLGMKIGGDGTVLEWKDRSGRGAAASGDSRPSWNRSPINGQATVRFDATKSQSLRLDVPIAGVHAFAVHRRLRTKKGRGFEGFWTLFDGAAAEPLHEATGRTVATAGARIGQGAASDYYHGDWAELVVYDRALTPDDRRLLLDYFNRRYALGAK